MRSRILFVWWAVTLAVLLFVGLTACRERVLYEETRVVPSPTPAAVPLDVLVQRVHGVLEEERQLRRAAEDALARCRSTTAPARPPCARRTAPAASDAWTVRAFREWRTCEARP